MFRRNLALIAIGLLTVLAGCSTDTNLGGVAVPNARPDTRVTGQPPTLLEASFVVTFNWTGADPDGRIVGYQWKISDNGTDGISPRDTLTYDPLTGAEMNPWHFTTATDSSFVVLADRPDFPATGSRPAATGRTPCSCAPWTTRARWTRRPPTFRSPRPPSCPRRRRTSPASRRGSRRWCRRR